MKSKISIITITYNAGLHLERTIESVINQNYPYIEYIVIDGKSTDNTLEIIKKYESKIDRWVSEPDKGIYDAMNKGLSMASGEYILFLNAADMLYDSDVLQKVFTKTADADIFYGETEIINQAGKSQGRRRLKSPKTLTKKSLQYGMCVSHQSFIVKKSIAPQFNLKYSIAADYDWMLNCLKNAKEIVNTQMYLSKFMAGGYSRENTFKALSQRFRIMVKNYGFFKVVLNHFIIAARFFSYVLVKGKLN